MPTEPPKEGQAKQTRRGRGSPPWGGRDGKGRYTRTIDTAERDATAARLRSQRKTYQQIADEMGYETSASAYTAVQRAIAAVPREAGEEMRQLELDHLDMVAQKAEEIARKIHLAYNNKGILVHEGEVLQDDGPTMQALRLLKDVSESRRKLLGLDAETKVSLSGEITYQVIGVDPAGIADVEPEP